MGLDLETPPTFVFRVTLCSVLYLDGVKLGDTQATIQGFFISGMFYFITQSVPIKRLSAQRPFTTVFNPHLFISLIGQFAIHLYVLMISVSMAKPLNPTDEVCAA